MVLVKDYLAPCTLNVIFEFSHLLVYVLVSLEKVDKVFNFFFLKNKLARGNSSTKLDKIVWIRQIQFCPPIYLGKGKDIYLGIDKGVHITTDRIKSQILDLMRTLILPS